MVSTVSFPGLGLEFELNRVAFSIGGFAVYWYGLLIGIGFLLAGAYAQANTRRVGVDGDRLIDVILAGLVLGIIGARLYYVAFSWDMFKDNLMSIFNIRMGGIAIYGGIIGGILGGMAAARIRQVKICPALDLAAGAFLIGQSIGRWGNFVNVEAFGSNTTSIFGMTGPKIVGYLTQVKASGADWAQGIDPHMPVHPTFLYESVWCFLGFLIVALFLMRRRRFDGQAFLFYCMWYGTGRLFIEGLRTDSLMWGPVRVSQVFSGLCVLVAGTLMVAILQKKKRLGDAFLPLYITTPEGQAVAAGTFYQKVAKPEMKLEPREKAALDKDQDAHPQEEE